jgi:hypothetical protein
MNSKPDESGPDRKHGRGARRNYSSARSTTGARTEANAGERRSPKHGQPQAPPERGGWR